MSKFEYVSLEGLRLDGRRSHEVRNIDIACGTECDVDVMDYDGVSQVTHGLTRVAAYVKGPTEATKSRSRYSHGTNSDVVDLQCEVVMPTERRTKNTRNDRIVANLAQTVRVTFERVIIAHLYKRCSIHIFIDIIEADGGVKAAVINAACIALVDAGIAMKDLISSCTAVYLDSRILIDPNQQEAGAAISELTLGVSVSSNEIVYMDLESRNVIGAIDDMVNTCVVGSRQFTLRAKDQLTKYLQNIAQLNHAIHGNLGILS